ncbi:MAG: LysR family transcriptional regulator [Giesbergeria sp.]|uniref:LysR family transcriptional regulator n=1 Tax=Giesbergeria sp. TaxID=2818473 RepID=UPI0026208025|nr:LysR family transcriptional regulator [Giesbergeria sp.]MDD2608442.1 LysR family transcriptional regulator [Giesbergeria sp.]
MLNYRHLYYFWMVAKEGGLARAAERLDMAIQTISVQVRALEKSLGRQLLKPAGRTVVLTEAGEQVFARAEAIFQLGQRLEEDISQQDTVGASVRLAVGLSDGISKLAAHTLLRPVLASTQLRLLCHEGEFEQLQSELAQHHLDVVLAGQAAPPNPNLRLSSERMVSSPVDWYGPAPLVQASAGLAFPAVLQQLPILLPTAHSVLRASVNRWLEEQGLRPHIVGEFEDSALMSVFAAHGLGVFPVSRLGADDIGLMPGLVLLGRCEDLHEEIHAIYGRRGQHHPLVQKLLARGLCQ